MTTNRIMSPSCLLCDEAKRSAPLPWYKVWPMLIATAIPLGFVGWLRWAGIVASSDEQATALNLLAVSAGVATVFIAAAVGLHQWVRRNMIGYRLCAYLDSDGRHYHIHRWSPTHESASSKTIQFILRSGGWYRTCHVRNREEHWSIYCWNPWRVVSLIGGGRWNILSSDLGLMLQVVKYYSLRQALAVGLENGDLLGQLTTELLGLIDKEYQHKTPGSGSLAAKQLRQRLMRLLTSVYDSPRLRHLQMESGVSEELVAHWSEELAALERSSAQSQTDVRQPREMPQGAA